MIHRACRMEHFSPMFAWHSVSSAKGEIGGIACRKKQRSLQISCWNIMYLHLWLEHHVPAYEASKKMPSNFVISLAMRNYPL